MFQDASPGFTPLSAVGEFGLIDRLTPRFPSFHASVLKGVGDDAAVLDAGAGKCQVLTKDLLLEGVHFDLQYCPLPHIGYKAAIVNFSDIYAMNVRPAYMLVGLGLPNRISVEMVEALYEGLYAACKEHKVTLLGGDTTASYSGLTLSITVIGSGNSSALVYRAGAQVHDLVCVTGDLGAAYAGFKILEREKELFMERQQVQPDLQPWHYVIERQLRPRARRDVIDWFEQNELKPTSLIDLSDGLASELNHLARASGVGMRVYQDRLPIDYQTGLAASELDLLETHCALYGGEDYELLFTISQADYPKIQNEKGFTVIGHVQPSENGVELVLGNGEITPLTAMGFNHFRPQSGSSEAGI
jgi:thiamine-monophosphate kinase